ncbi:MAG: metalloenzyme [Anaerolineales bacterium]
MRCLFIFLDGVGLGEDDPRKNPFARAQTPYLESLLEGRKLLASSAPFDGERASLLALDAALGVDGLPQSATGQAVLLTGVNVPAALGYHYGPKPNPETAAFLNGQNLFAQLTRAGKRAALLNAYPPRYFHGIQSGKRLYSAIPLALTNAGLSLFTQDDYYAGDALSADFTGAGWREFLNVTDSPLFTPRQAGAELARLAKRYDFAFFEYWASDYAGHRQDMESAVHQLQNFDGVLQGLMENWRGEDGLVFLTSDHGNMEDLSTRRHTPAPVPLLLLGEKNARRVFSKDMKDLTGVAPAILRAVMDDATGR